MACRFERCRARSAPAPQRGGRPLLVVLGLLLGLLLAVAPASAASAFDEGTIHSLVNRDRAANGLGPLTLNASLSQVALGWANQLVASGTLSHNPNYSAQIPGGWSRAAENVAQGYASGAAVHSGWMNSSGHRANILGDFTDIGIAHIAAGGTTWSVEVFAKYGGSVPAPAPPPPVPAPAPAPAPAPPPAPAPESEATPEPGPTASEVPEAPTASASPKPSDERAEDPAPPDAEGADEGFATKLVLGIALLVAFATAIIGWLRTRLHS